MLTPNLIPQLSARLHDAFLVGGLTSSRLDQLQVADGVAEGGVAGVLFDATVPVVTALTQGCSPIGPRRTVTESRHNIIISIDDRPALEVLKEDIGEVLSRDLGRLAGYIFAARPVYTSAGVTLSSDSW